MSKYSRKKQCANQIKLSLDPTSSQTASSCGFTPEHGRAGAISQPRRPWINKTSNTRHSSSCRKRLGDLSFLPNGQSWQLLLQTSQLFIWKKSLCISSTVWPRIFDHMTQLQIMIFLFDASHRHPWGPCLRHTRICPCISSNAAVAVFNLGEISAW